MSKNSSIILTVIAVLLLQGCTSKLSMIIWSDDELTIEHFEKDIVTYENWTPEPGVEEDPPERWGLINVCKSYFRQRQLSTALECALAYEQLHLPLIPEEVSGRWKVLDASNYRYLFHTTMLEIYLELGEFEKAEYHADQGIQENIKKWGDIQWTVYISTHARFLANASIAFEKSGNHARALELVPFIPLVDYKGVFTAIVTSREVKARHIQEAKAWIALGEYDNAEYALNRAMNNKEWALRGILFMQTLGISELAGAGDQMTNPFSIDELFMMSKVALMKKDYDTARSGYDYILKGDYSDHKHAMQTPIDKRKGLHYLVLYDRAQIALHNKDDRLAESLLRQALGIIESQRALINTESSKIGFVGDKQAVYRDLIHLLVKTSQPSEAFLIVERSKSRALVDMLASKNQFGNNTSTQKNTHELIAELDDAESSEMVLSSKTKNAPNNTIKTRNSDDIRSQIILSEPEFASLVTVQKPTLENIRKSLPANETLIEYYGDEQALYAFVLTNKSISSVTLNKVELQKYVERYRLYLQSPSENQRGLKKTTTLAKGARDAGKQIYQKIFAPLKSLIETDNITIVPHASLHYLPFAALPTPYGYLLDSYNIKVSPSASSLEFLNTQKAQSSKTLVAFGNPELGNPSLSLPGAEKEAKAITNNIANADVYIKAQATETRVKQLANQYRFIHFALHGTFNADKPLSSGLLMAADEENDGYLTVSELYELDMSSAEMVTLSACETALGKVANGDDVVGFTRAFFFAGASSIVSSLWKVDDEATSILMQQFYKNLTVSDKRIALKNAQRYIRDNVNQHPYYWAAFQLTGLE